jgi:hypothetical protein
VLTQTDNWRPSLDRFQRISLIVGVVGVVLCGVGALLGPAQFFHSLIFAFFFWITLTIGAAIVLMIQHLTGGVWGLMLRRMLEAATMTMPLMLVVFLVLLAGIGDLWPWSHAEEVAASEVLQAKAPYLNVPFFIGRAIFYFAIFILIGYLLNRWSSEQDSNPDSKIADRLRTLSGPGIPVFVLLWTLAATDWGMSLEPEWFSSMYPVTFIIEGLLGVMAWGIIALTVMRSRKMLPYNVPIDRLHDLGKFMFAFTVVWAYINFSQFLIIWSGNIPEETPWYYHRLNGGWQVPAVMLMVGHFFLPFFALISRHVKRNYTGVTTLAVWIVLIQIVFVFWTVTPAFYADGFHISLLDPLALIGVGGLWMALWARNLKQRPLLPPNDHRMPELEKQAAGDGHGHGKSHAAGHGEAHAH